MPAVLVQIDIQAVTLGDAATILAQRLPHVRCAWLDLLRDEYRCRHRRRTPGGHKLLPLARVRLPGGGVPRPVFAVTDIDAFVTAVDIASGTAPTVSASAPANVVTVRLPRADLAGPWQMRRAEVTE
ncbi:MAG: hypothetical protein QM811_11365 [Pirellulales bacterium]